jgi:hypothetical protein
LLLLLVVRRRRRDPVLLLLLLPLLLPDCAEAGGQLQRLPLLHPLVVEAVIVRAVT